MFKKNLYFCEKLNPQKWALITEIKHLNWFIGPVHVKLHRVGLNGVQAATESPEQSADKTFTVKRIFIVCIGPEDKSVARRQEQNQPGL